jgi:hypothetical protein
MAPATCDLPHALQPPGCCWRCCHHCGSCCCNSGCCCSGSVSQADAGRHCCRCCCCGCCESRAARLRVLARHRPWPAGNEHSPHSLIPNWTPQLQAHVSSPNPHPRPWKAPTHPMLQGESSEEPATNLHPRHSVAHLQHLAHPKQRT